ncbi:uncharacterized protein LOC112031825 [Quercus suber]|uniref:uncharacterized protein LOC112031825 n=1 Tax=Quercus suber TaxID=58331 RepID=UPI0032DF6529
MNQMMTQDYVADLPLEGHVVPDDVADVPQEAQVVEDRVANLPQEAHVVEDHVANLQQECAICVTNAMGMAFLCGHTTCGMWGKIGQMSHLLGTDQLPYQVVLGVTMPREFIMNA